MRNRLLWIISALVRVVSGFQWLTHRSKERSGPISPVIYPINRILSPYFFPEFWHRKSILRENSREKRFQMTRQKRNLRHLLSFVILGLLFAGMGCQSGPGKVDETCPEWVESIPSDKTYYYAIGISGPTPRPADAWAQAKKRARAELALTITSDIKVDDTIISSSSGQYVKEIVRILSDTELNFTEVIERWFDQYGICGHSDHCYVLVRIERSTAVSLLRSLK